MTVDNEELDALDKRLRASTWHTSGEPLRIEAATAIRTLRARVAELDASLSLYGVGANVLAGHQAGAKVLMRQRDEAIARAELAESQLQQVKADAERTERELQQYRLHVRERRYVDATPNEDLPARILHSYLDETICISEPPALAEIMNDASAKRNAILRRSLQVLSFAARRNDGTA